MLLNAIFSVVLVAVLAGALLSASIAAAHLGLQRAAQSFVAAGMQRATGSLIQTLAAGVQNGSPAPTFTPLPPVCANPACSMLTGASIRILNATPAVGPICDASQNNCAPNVQSNGYVGENRIAARIMVTVLSAGGVPLATRSSDVIVRTTQTPPYAALAGARDGAFDDVTGGASPGDDGGTLPATPNPCGSAAPGSSADTTVRVQYRNTATSACTDGSSFGNASYTTSPGAPAGWTP